MSLLNHPLDDVLGSTSKVRLLRLMIQQDRTFSGREAAQLIGTSRTAVLAALNDLVKLGLIHREESGRQFLCRANREHRLVRTALEPLFTVESGWTDVLFSTLREAVMEFETRSAGMSAQSSRDILAAWIFGSVATGRDKPGSDLDLFVLTRESDMVSLVSEHILEYLLKWQRELGADVRPLVMSLREAVKQSRARNRFIIEAIRYGRVLIGEIPAELRIGKTNGNAKNR